MQLDLALSIRKSVLSSCPVSCSVCSLARCSTATTARGQLSSLLMFAGKVVRNVLRISENCSGCTSSLPPTTCDIHILHFTPIIWGILTVWFGVLSVGLTSNFQIPILSLRMSIFLAFSAYCIVLLGICKLRSVSQEHFVELKSYGFRRSNVIRSQSVLIKPVVDHVFLDDFVVVSKMIVARRLSTSL